MAITAIQSDPIRRCFGKHRMNHSYLSVGSYRLTGCYNNAAKATEFHEQENSLWLCAEPFKKMSCDVAFNCPLNEGRHVSFQCFLEEYDNSGFAFPDYQLGLAITGGVPFKWLNLPMQ